MKILHIDTGATLRGGQRQVLLLLEALRSAGYESILAARPGGALAQTAERAGFAVIEAKLRLIRRYSAQAEIVHAHDARGHTLAALVSRTPFVVARRVAFPVKRSLLSRWKYRRASRYLAVSRFVADMLQQAGINNDRIDVVYDAVAPISQGRYNPAAPAVALALDDPMKGRDLIEEAATAAGIPVRFSVDLPTDLQEASMFIYITRSEGLGSAALLAMSMGIPVIASHTGGLAEVFEDGISGIYTTNEPAAIASAIGRLRQDPQATSRVISAAKQRIEARFAVNRLLTGTLESYRKALHA
jgi:glycosyltransferase involved in cell wall biosynthesis